MLMKIKGLWKIEVTSDKMIGDQKEARDEGRKSGRARSFAVAHDDCEGGNIGKRRNRQSRSPIPLETHLGSPDK
jgi:hypothetical protein